MMLGISTAAFYGRMETEEAAALISSLPVDCAEVFMQTFSEYTEAFAETVRGNLGRVRCTSVHPNGTQFEAAMFGQSRRQAEDAFGMFRNVLSAGKKLEAGYYVWHGKFSTQKLLPWNLSENMRVLSRMTEEAKEFGMRIAWESVWWCQLTNAERVREARAAMPDVCFTLDIKQTMRAGEDPCRMARAMGEGLSNIHLVDWKKDGQLCLPGEGDFDFDSFFHTLADIGFSGPVILEPYADLVRDRGQLISSLLFLKEKMDEAS